MNESAIRRDTKPGGGGGTTNKMKTTNKAKTLGTVGAVSALLATPTFAAAGDITSAVSGIAADVGTGLAAGVAIGAVFLGGRLVWRAIKGVAS